MENQPKKIEFDVDSIDNIKYETNDETCFFDEKLPDHILKKIISFVPNKDNCFLVNKRFQKESINATRNRYRLLLDNKNIKEFESILKMKKKFDTLRYSDFGEPNDRLHKLKEIIKCFGSSIKTFELCGDMHNDDFLDVLDLMKNLEHLTYRVAIGNNVSVKTVQLNHLKSLTIVENTNEDYSLESLSCPALQEIILEDEIYDSEPVYNFICRHTQLKQLTYRNPSIDTIEWFIGIDGLRLTTLKIQEFQDWHQDSIDQKASALALISNLSKQKELKVLELPINCYFINGQVLKAISKLPMLETLSVYHYYAENIADILQMDKLKALKTMVSDLEDYIPLATVQNLKLETLEMEIHLYDLGEVPKVSTTHRRELLKAMAKNLRNLKTAKFANFSIEDVLIFASNSPSLQNLRIFDVHWSHGDGTVIVKHGCNLHLETESLLSILKLQILTELRCEKKYLEQSEVISTIMEHGKKLEKIIVYTDEKTFSAYSAYASQFPVKKRGSKRYQVVMMRS